MITKICENCGKEFSVIKSREFTAKYCCRKCSDESKKENLILDALFVVNYFT